MKIRRDDYSGHIVEAQCEKCGMVYAGLTDITDESQINHECEDE